MRLFLLLAIYILGSVASGRAQQAASFEGWVRYNISYKGEFADQASYLLPTTLRVYCTPGKLRVETQSATDTGWSSIVLYGAATDTVFVLDSAAKVLRYAIPGMDMTTATLDSNCKQVPGQDVILGYVCNKYNVQTVNAFGKMQSYYAACPTLMPDLTGLRTPGGLRSYFFETCVKGLPLKVLQYVQSIDLLTTLEAYEVKRQKLDNTLFVLPNWPRVLFNPAE